MKKILLSTVLTVFMICLSVASVGADIPNLIRFQGKLTDSVGAPLNGNHNITFRIYDAETAGALLWNETQTAVPVSNGIFSVLLGNVMSLTVAFDVPYWLSIEVNSDGEMAPRQAITSVGYAFYAENGIPAGTIIMRRGTTCPTGYTRVSELDGKFLVGGSTYSAAAGGNNTSNHGGNTGSHSLTTAEMPSHTHQYSAITGYDQNQGQTGYNYGGPTNTTNTQSTGGGSGHNHSISSDDNRPEFASVILCEKL